MRVRWFFKRYILFIIILLIIIPVLLSLFIHAPDYHFKLRTVFLLQRFYVTFSALVLILLIIAYNKIKDYKPAKTDARQIILFSALSLVFFALAFGTQTDYDKILSEGVSVDNRVRFDSSRWLIPRMLSDMDVIEDKSILIDDDSGKLRREIILEKVPEEAEIIWNGYWEDRDGNGVLSDNCSVLLEVNTYFFNITEPYSNLETNKKGWMQITVDANHLVQGRNTLVISKECSDAVAVTSQTTYIKGATSKFRNDKWDYLSFDELVLYVRQDNSAVFKTLFKLGFVFRVFAVTCLFIAVFGIGFLRFLFRRARLELVFSFVYALFMYWFATIIRGYWLFFSKLVTYTTYALLRVSFLNPIMDFSNPTLPFLGVKGFTLGIADTCSGIESLGYFVLAYSILIIINWNSIDFKKALLLFIPGLVGTFLVNILRVYFLFLIGISISKSFALNAYHTNAGMVLFIIYFIIFWPLAMKFIKKKEAGEKEAKKKKQ